MLASPNERTSTTTTTITIASVLERFADLTSLSLSQDWSSVTASLEECHGHDDYDDDYNNNNSDEEDYDATSSNGFKAK